MYPKFGSGQSASASLPGRAQGAFSYMSPAPLIVDHLKRKKRRTSRPLPPVLRHARRPSPRPSAPCPIVASPLPSPRPSPPMPRPLISPSPRPSVPLAAAAPAALPFPHAPLGVMAGHLRLALPPRVFNRCSVSADRRSSFVFCRLGPGEMVKPKKSELPILPPTHAPPLVLARPCRRCLYVGVLRKESEGEDPRD